MLSLEAVTSPRRSSRNSHKTRPLSSSTSCSSNSLTPPSQHSQDRKGKSRALPQHSEDIVELSIGSTRRQGKRGARDETDKESTVESMQQRGRGEGSTPARLNQHTQQSDSNLPHLLSHLSLSNPFQTPYASTSTFVFPTLESSLLILKLPPLPTSKRPPPLPPASRCKKRKLLHSFIRSPLLLSPAPSTRSRSRSSSSCSGAIPKWWASISNCSGESKPSRFSPSEESWITCPTLSDNWLTSTSTSPSSSSPQTLLTSRQRSLLLPVSSDRPLLSHSISAPSILLPRQPTPTPPSDYSEEEIPISGPALKKLLLMSLRNKWTSEGGPTSAGEAALRFKKWVLWNHWRISSSTEIEPSSSSSSDCILDNLDSNLPSNSSSFDDDSKAATEDLNKDNEDSMVPSSYFTTITTDDEGSEFIYEGEKGGGDCWFTKTGQMVFATPSSSNSSNSSNTTKEGSLLPTPPGSPKEKEGRKGRPGLRRSETVPSNLPGRSLCV